MAFISVLLCWRCIRHDKSSRQHCASLSLDPHSGDASSRRAGACSPIAESFPNASPGLFSFLHTTSASNQGTLTNPATEQVPSLPQAQNRGGKEKPLPLSIILFNYFLLFKAGFLIHYTKPSLMALYLAFHL